MSHRGVHEEVKESQRSPLGGKMSQRGVHEEVNESQRSP